MLNRVQARIRFTKASGLATWAYNQMAAPPQWAAVRLFGKGAFEEAG